ELSGAARTLERRFAACGFFLQSIYSITSSARASSIGGTSRTGVNRRKPTTSHRASVRAGSRTGQVQLMARGYGEFYHGRGVAAELRYNMLHGRTPAQAYDGMAWLYGGM